MDGTSSSVVVNVCFTVDYCRSRVLPVKCDISIGILTAGSSNVKLPSLRESSRQLVWNEQAVLHPLVILKHNAIESNPPVDLFMVDGFDGRSINDEEDVKDLVSKVIKFKAGPVLSLINFGFD